MRRDEDLPRGAPGRRALRVVDLSFSGFAVGCASDEDLPRGAPGATRPTGRAVEDAGPYELLRR